MKAILIALALLATFFVFAGEASANTCNGTVDTSCDGTCGSGCGFGCGVYVNPGTGTRVVSSTLGSPYHYCYRF